MPIDLAQLSENAYTLNAVTNLILVRPQVNNGYRAQIGTTLDTPILFNYEVDNKASLESDITDYFVEDNTAINDQISLKPEIVTVRGLVGELNNVAPSFLSGIAETARDRLTNIGAYAPELSLTAQRAYNLAFQAYQLASNSLQNINATLDRAFDTNTIIGSDGIEDNPIGRASQTQQQIYFRKFYTYWRNRTLFTIQTPWAIFKNMAIQKLTAIQDGESDLISDFEIQFKIIRFSQTLNSNLSFEGRSLTQAASVVNNGSTSGVPV
jgi:hypothetical protein